MDVGKTSVTKGNGYPQAKYLSHLAPAGVIDAARLLIIRAEGTKGKPVEVKSQNDISRSYTG